MKKKDIINYAKKNIEGLFNIPLDLKKYGYLLSNITIDANFQYKIECDNFLWKQISEIKENPVDWWTYYVIFKLDFNGRIVVKDSNTFVSEKNAKFDLFVDLWFKTDRIDYNYRILDKKYKIIKDYVEQIENSNISHEIYSLLNDNIKFNNKRFFHFAKEITSKTRNLNVRLNDFNIINDIARTSQDLKYLLGEITELRNYIGNYTSNPQIFNGKLYYDHHISFIDKRYFLLIGVMFEILYNYWDKLGDLLAKYFTPNLLPRQIYFPIVINNIQSPFDQSNNYSWLKNFKDNEYKKINSERKQIVHYLNIESKFHEIYRSKSDSKTELLKLQDKKTGLTNFLHNQFKLTIKGFEKTFLLIDEIN